MVSETASMRENRERALSQPKDGLGVLLVQVAPDGMEYPFRSHPLGLMYLAAYVEREVPGVRVDLLDMRVTRAGTAGLARLVAEKKPDVVGFSSMSVHAEWIHRSAASARPAAPEALFLAGGPHPTCFPARVLQDENIDAVVMGEGERALADILRARKEGRPPDGIPAVGTAASLEPGTRNIIENLDELPFPAWHKINVEDYFAFSSFSILGRRRYMSMFSSRACPYSCIYCHSIFGRKYRPRGAENVLSEIRLLIEKYGVRDFDMLDDVFNLNKERAVEIFEGIIRESAGISIAFPNGLRSDLLDEELIKLMARAGTTYISFAIETASPRLQSLIHKNLKLDKAFAAIRAASKAGILCNGYFMMGFPTETEPELKQTIDFAIHSPLQLAHFLRVTPFEGTGLFDLVDEKTKKVLLEHPEFLCYEDRHLNLSEIPTPRFRALFRYALMRFYLNPFRIAAIFRRHPNRWNLMQFVPIALKRIFIKG